jgi:hypothetical protein
MPVSPEVLALFAKQSELMEQFQQSLTALNAEPGSVPTAPQLTQGVGDGLTNPIPTRKLLSPEQMFEMRTALRQKSTAELMMLFSQQARRKDTGIPLDVWLNRGGYAAQERFNGLNGELDDMTRKALDTGGAAALIRQDLEPILYELYVRQFPAFDRFSKEPANGLTHTFQQITNFGGAEFMAELGTVVDDKSTYVRQTTNVAIIATRRGISLKSQFAITAGGMAFNAEQLELQGGLRAMSLKMQQTLFGGNGTDSGGTAANELGLYDANGFTGLRSILNTVRAKNVDPATSPDTTGYIRRAVDAATVEITQAGGTVPTIAWTNPWDMNTFNEQQDSKTRIVVPNQVNIGVGVTAREVNTIAGNVPFGIVPGNSIAEYTYAGASEGGVVSGNTVRDIYLLDEQSISMPYLGTDGPTVLDIPIGISGQLTHMFIIFGMWGLAVKAPQFSNKVRVKI